MILIWVTTTFPGCHRWQKAPDEVDFLRNYHRHLFHVKVACEVTGDDREIEFFMFKQKLEAFLTQEYKCQYFEYSCEMICQHILDKFPEAYSATVSEDGENGASVMREAKPLAAPTTQPIRPKPQWPTTGQTTQEGASQAAQTAQIPRPMLQTALQKRDKCFIGVETEGPARGLKTLFVPGSVTVQRVQSITGLDIEQIYYGAGNDRVLNEDTIQILLSKSAQLGIPITIETTYVFPELVEIKESIKKRMTLVLYNDWDDRADYCKMILADKVFWVSTFWAKTSPSYHINITYVTDLNDPLYEQDRDIE